MRWRNFKPGSPSNGLDLIILNTQANHATSQPNMEERNHISKKVCSYLHAMFQTYCSIIRRCAFITLFSCPFFSIFGQ